MTFWARLTWQVADPAALAADLERKVGVMAAEGGSVPGALTAALGTAVLEIRPWRQEADGDHPHAGGRLVFEPVPDGDEEPFATAQPHPDTPPASPPPSAVLAGVGWATVDLDRADAELDPWLAPRAGPAEPDGNEPLLGARARRRGAGGLPAGSIVLLEPITEGRLAASLARDGEGPCAVYLAPREGLAAFRRAARARGIATTGTRPGPLGPSSLVLGGTQAGPHVIVIDRPS
jgi:hypothetical protein